MEDLMFAANHENKTLSVLSWGTLVNPTMKLKINEHVG